jgi:hypothetical protein
MDVPHFHTGKNLATPYVALSFAIQDGNGKKKYHSLELTYAEFQDFCNSFQEVAGIMDEM